jgi:hypothetical protein
LTLTDDEIVKFLDDLDQESKAIKDELLRMCWYMRGGLTYEESMYLSRSEREIIGKLIDDNLETTKKSGMPFY